MSRWRRNDSFPLHMTPVRIYAWMWLLLCLFGMQTAVVAEVPVAQGTTHDAVTVIDAFHAALLSTMKRAKSLGYTGRYTHLEPTLRKSYDFPGVVRIVAGKYWHDLNDTQRAQFIRIFSRLVIATYAYRFDGYSGELFQTVSSHVFRHGQVIVRTVLIKKDHTRVHLDYLLRQRKGQWRIINVVAQGVSDLALKRVEYTTELRKHGFDILMARLKGKIAQYER